MYVYSDREHSVGVKYDPCTPCTHEQKRNPLNEFGPSWFRLEKGGAFAFAESKDQLARKKVEELMRWLVYSDPSSNECLADCATWLVGMSSTATCKPLSAEKRCYIADPTGTRFVVHFAVNEILDDFSKKIIGIERLEHFEKYPECQWFMVWEDVFGAIQMAARDHALTSEVGDVCSRVSKFDANEKEPTKPEAKPMGWTQKELIDCVEGAFAEKTFTRIREDAGIEPSESGGEGAHRKYDCGQLKLMITALENTRRHNKKSIIGAWKKKCEGK